MAPVTTVPLDQTTRQRYLNYALSVITARALPDVRDGLKPVQRRILFSMFHNHRLSPDRPPIKSAKVVGSVIGEWHPHGDSAVYDAMARMAQWWSLRAPLVDGHGNFGSLDGDPPAAYRYTEAKLTPVAIELLNELNKDTVDFQPNYDGKDKEPLVLPAPFPNLLVNGSTGIAVGMATNVPPHNLAEVVNGAVALIDDRTCTIADLMKSIKGPDFPTGGEILNTRTELREIYETGQGLVRLRGEFTVGPPSHGKSQIVITSIPFAVDKATVVERIGELIAARKVPQLVDVRDESTTDVQIVLELQKDADADLAMAYLFKNTPLQNNFSVNLTSLIPVSGTTTTRPRCLTLKEILEQFIDFRFETVTRRFSYDLRILEQRIHILSGFQSIFDALDRVLTIIRQSDGKADSAEKVKREFRLDDAQTNAILETPIYKLSRTEIKKMLDELADKRKQALDLKTLLASKPQLWNVVKTRAPGPRQDVRRQTTDQSRASPGRRSRIRPGGLHRQRRRRGHHFNGRVDSPRRDGQGPVENAAPGRGQPADRLDRQYGGHHRVLFEFRQRVHHSDRRSAPGSKRLWGSRAKVVQIQRRRTHHRGPQFGSPIVCLAAGRSTIHGTGAPALRRSTGGGSRPRFPWARDRRVIGRHGRALRPGSVQGAFDPTRSKIHETPGP